MSDRNYFKTKFAKGYKITKNDYDDLFDSVYFNTELSGATGSFTSSDNKTVTVINGIITEII